MSEAELATTSAAGLDGLVTLKDAQAAAQSKVDNDANNNLATTINPVDNGFAPYADAADKTLSGERTTHTTVAAASDSKGDGGAAMSQLTTTGIDDGKADAAAGGVAEPASDLAGHNALALELTSRLAAHNTLAEDALRLIFHGMMEAYPVEVSPLDRQRLWSQLSPPVTETLRQTFFALVSERLFRKWRTSEVVLALEQHKSSGHITDTLLSARVQTAHFLCKDDIQDAMVERAQKLTLETWPGQIHTLLGHGHAAAVDSK